LPFVFLSTDLPEKALENQRNASIASCLQPWFYVFGHNAALEFPGPCIGIDALLEKGLAHGLAKSSPPPCSILCYLFTGGTQRTKVVQVSHAMVLHEHKAYRDLWSAKRSRTVVLAHTSVYWGASALGQLSIALAFSGTVVWTEAVDVADLHRCIKEEGVTVLGVVPDHLDLLAPEAPEHELPSVEIVFTWGERLPRRVTDRWRSHSRAILRELLISTEYWLALYADPLGDGILRTVSGVETRVLGDDGHEVGLSEVGELCIAGPMVTPGYVTIEGLIPPPDVFCTFCGRSFFRTRDLVRRVPGGLIYKGRADMMAKERGKMGRYARS
jgi:acyl-coenzyme A synthetase/AMP-(fatty) acid ligase